MISAAYFGAEDFIADLGGVRTASNDEVAYARAQVALAGRLAEVTVIDQVVADFTDDDRCRRECLEACSMGYGGKLCIHPSQVAIANAAFLPSSEEIDRARRLLEAYDDAKAQGVASVAFEGQMVDEPVAVQARACSPRLTTDQPPSGRHSMSAFRTVRHTRTSSWLNTRCSNVTTPWFGRDDDARRFRTSVSTQMVSP